MAVGSVDDDDEENEDEDGALEELPVESLLDEGTSMGNDEPTVEKRKPFACPNCPARYNFWFIC